MSTINKEECPTCHRSINIREIGLFSGMVDALVEVFKWCKENDTHEFSRKEIKHLLKNDNQIARFGDWVMFGGLVYKKGKGHYGLNLERCEQFFKGGYTIPTTVYKNPLTKTITGDRYRTIKTIPKLSALLDENLEYIARYYDKQPEQGSLL